MENFIEHRYAIDSRWTIMEQTKLGFVVSIGFKEYYKQDGCPERLVTVDCLCVESDSLEIATNRAIELAKIDGRPFSIGRYKTWEIKEPKRLTGLRDNARID